MNKSTNKKRKQNAKLKKNGHQTRQTIKSNKNLAQNKCKDSFWLSDLHKGDRWEFISVCLLLLWCILPICVLIHNICLGLTGKYPLEMTQLGYEVPYDFYYSQVKTFLMLVRVLGIITVIYATFCIFICHKRIFNRKQMKKQPWMYLLLGVLLWTCLSAVLSADFSVAFIGIPLIYSGLASIFIYAAVFICASMIRREWYRRLLVRTFCGVLTFLSVLLFIKVYTHSFLDNCFVLETTSVFNQKNHWCYMLCMGTMCMAGLFLFDGKRSGDGDGAKKNEDGSGERAKRGQIIRLIIYAVCFTILLYALLLSDTFGSYLAVLIAIPILYIFYYRSGRKIHIITWAPAIIFIALSVFNSFGLMPQAYPVGGQLADLGKIIVKTFGGNEEASSDTTEQANEEEMTSEAETTEQAIDPTEAAVLQTKEKDLPEGMTKDDLLTYYYGDNTTRRIVLWKNTVYRIKERPIFGFGPEGFHDENAITYNDSPHNECLQMAAYIGIPGLLLYLLALLVLFIHHWMKMRELDSTVLAVSGGVVGYLISAFTGNPVFNTAPYFFMLFGLVTASNELEAPLIALEEEQTERDLLKKVLVKRNGVILIIAALVGLAVLGVVHHNRISDEQKKELADLQTMRDAASNILLASQNNTLELNTDYWYDKSHNRLLPVTDPAPKAYGKGTDVRGNGLEKFNEEYGLNYEYDETADYRNRILKVGASPDESGNLSVNMVWTSRTGE